MQPHARMYACMHAHATRVRAARAWLLHQEGRQRRPQEDRLSYYIEEAKHY